MKIINIALSLLALAATVASCSDSNDELPMMEPQSEISASFRLSMPNEIGTRADGDVENSTFMLEWTIFDVTDGNPKIFSSGSQPLESLADDPTVELQLIKEMQYKITFCAYDSRHRSFAHYEDGKIIVDYSAAGSIQLGDDLFTGASDTFKATRDLYVKEVKLTRPFAQLNWGSSDLDAVTVAPYLDGTFAAVTVENGLYQTLDLLTGEYSDPVEGAVTFHNFDCGEQKEKSQGISMFGEGYLLLASNLLLVGSEASVNCKMTFTGNVEAVATVSNAPMKRNYRTNIYGSLISDPRSLILSIDESFLGNKDFTGF